MTETKDEIKLRFDALGHYVAVHMAESKSETDGRHGLKILLPDEAKKEAHVGEVVSVGADVTIEIGEGDIVAVHPYGGHFIEGCDRLRIIKDTDCLAVVRKEF